LHMFYNGYTCVFKCFRCFCKCFEHILQVFQLFLTYIASVSSECSKSKSDMHMLQYDPPTTVIYYSTGAPCMRMESGGG
jgi:hypothetical protein